MSDLALLGLQFETRGAEKVNKPAAGNGRCWADLKRRAPPGC